MSFGMGFPLPATAWQSGTGATLNFNFLSGTMPSNVTFTRASTGTYVGSNGLLQTAAAGDARFDYDPTSYVQQNLLTYSEQFDNAVWSKTTATVTADTAIAPDGTPTADTITATAVGSNTGFISQTFTLVASTSYVYSIYVKHGTESSVMLQAICTVTGVNSGCFAIFNVSNGTVSSASSYGSVSGATASIAASTNGYYRCTLVLPVPAGTITGGAVWFFPYSGSDAANTYAYAWGAQLNIGSTALPYAVTTTAPYTLVAARGLLIEELRANLLTFSNDFTNVVWNNANVTVTAANINGPDGALSGSKLAATATVATNFYQNATVAATSATGVVFVKQGTSATVANTFALRNVTTAIDLVAGTINYSTGVFTYSVGSTGVFVTNTGNGWWRIALTATSGITSSDTLRFYVGFTGAVATAGDFLYAYGAQLEAGAFATSYIPTTTSQVTRAADVATVNTLSPWFNAVAGTLYAEYDAYAPISGAAFGIAVLSDGSSSNRTYLFLGGGTAAPSLVVISGGVAQANIGNSAISANAITKTAGAYAVNDFAIATNAGTVATDASGALAIGQNRLELGNFLLGTFLNGHIRRIRYYPARLSNAQLQSITT